MKNFTVSVKVLSADSRTAHSAATYQVAAESPNQVMGPLVEALEGMPTPNDDNDD